jgi:[ribosomal protein S18]-alanine N-acetyltransferase
MTCVSTMVSIEIRRMLPTDLDPVAEIDSLSFSLPWPKSSFDYELKNPVSHLWVAESLDPPSTGRIVGMICTWVIENEAHIATFAIHPDFRRQGLGARLLCHALIEAAQQGVELVYLEVRRSNQAAILLYQSFGFEMTGIRPRYYSDNHEDALMMTLRKIDPQTLLLAQTKYS